MYANNSPVHGHTNGSLGRVLSNISTVAFMLTLFKNSQSTLSIITYLSLHVVESLMLIKRLKSIQWRVVLLNICQVSFLKFQGCLFKGAVVRGRVIYVFIYVLIYLCLFGDKRQWSFLKVYICYWINYVYDKIKLSRKFKNSVNH